MKFIVAALLFVAAFQAISAQNEPSKRTKCTYFVDKLTLSCVGPTGKVECEAASSMPFPAKLIGLGFPVNPIKGLQKFDLFPLRSDNTAWLNREITIDGKTVAFSLYQSPTIMDAGLRLRTPECFDKLSALFRSSASSLSVPVASDLTSAGPFKTKIELFGEIFWFNQTFPTKKTQTVKPVTL